MLKAIDIKYDITINVTEQMTMDVTVVLYFLLFLFIFLYEIMPPMPQILPIIAGVLSFADFIFISFVFLIASSGVTFAALLALPVAEK